MWLIDDDRDVIRADQEATADSGQSRRSLTIAKHRLHRTRVGIELDRLPDHVTAAANSSRKRRSTSAGSEYELKTSSAEIVRRCEQWLNDVRRATGGYVAAVTTSGCQSAPAVDNKLT